MMSSLYWSKMYFHNDGSLKQVRGRHIVSVSHIYRYPVWEKYVSCINEIWLNRLISVACLVKQETIIIFGQIFHTDVYIKFVSFPHTYIIIDWLTYVLTPTSSFSAIFMTRTYSIIYRTTLPHDKLKTRFKETIHKAFSHRNYGSKFVVLGHNSTYFSNKIQKGKTCYSEEQVISMLEFLIDSIFVSFGGTLFQQVAGIPMSTNCAPLLTDLFVYSYESEFLQKLLKDKKIHEARAFNFTYKYIDDVLSINNSRFAEFLPLIYPPELEVQETTYIASSASFLDLYLEFDDSGQLGTKNYDKRDDFNFKIINFQTCAAIYQLLLHKVFTFLIMYQFPPIKNLQNEPLIKSRTTYSPTSKRGKQYVAFIHKIKQMNIT